VEFVRSSYDVERAMEGIRQSELPDQFADFLRTGGWLVAGAGPGPGERTTTRARRT